MPSDARKSYFSIRALNVELASIKDGSVSRKVGGAQFDESGASMALKIRVQWWREAINQIYGNGSTVDELSTTPDFVASMANSVWKNPVVRVLDYAAQESKLTRRFLERLLEAREEDLDVRQVETMNDAIAYAESTFSSLLYLSLETTNVSSYLEYVGLSLNGSPCPIMLTDQFTLCNAGSRGVCRLGGIPRWNRLGFGNRSSRGKTSIGTG
jgi:hypothetical protein